jgi:hypothetical protein
VVDANAIVRGAWRLESAAWRVLLHQSGTQQIHLVVPDLVVREAVARFRDDLRARVARLVTALDKLGNLVPVIRLPDVDENAEVVAYEKDLRIKLAAAGAEVAALPAVDLVSLTQDAIDRRRPFDEKGSGFRDALLWQMVLATVKQDLGQHVALVSHDNRAFGDASKSSAVSLHVDLSSDLAKAGFSGQFRLLGSVAAALDWTGVDDPTGTASALDAARNQHDGLAGAVQTILVGAELRSPWTAVSAHIISAEDIHVRLLRTVGADDGLLLAHLLVGALLNVELAFDDNETSFTRSATARVDLPSTASFDAGEQRFADLDVSLPSTETVAELVELEATLRRANELLSRLDRAERFAVGYPELTVRELGTMLGASASQAHLIRQRAVQILGTAVRGEVDGEALALLVMELARPPEER